ncbi:MAG: homoserine O-acetyltransferase [Bacteroidales bacterium]|nr:homoserine O-acetyltransferase [Bacteroidales bacterium]
MQRHTLVIEEAFELEAGGRLPRLELAYHASPRAYRPGDRVVWICHALTASSDAEDWWSGLVGPGKHFDTERDFVVCVNILGSPYGSSGPARINPRTGTPWLLDFPAVTIRDFVRASILVRKHLGISSIDLLVGSSTGGFQVLEWCVMEPDLIVRAAIIATDARVTPYLSAYDTAQRMALEADASFARAEDLRGGRAGLQCARAIAMISYRSYEGYNRTQAEPDPDTVFASRSASYQRHQGKKLSDRFDAYSYAALIRACESNNLGRGRGGVRAALASIRARCAVVCIDSDSLFPPVAMRPLAEAIPGAFYHEISSPFGHDGFLLENEQLATIFTELCKS